MRCRICKGGGDLRFGVCFKCATKKERPIMAKKSKTPPRKANGQFRKRKGAK